MILKRRYDTKVVQEAIIYIGASLSSFITSKITRSEATSHTNLCDQLTPVILNTEIIKISDTRRDSIIIKEAVINICASLFSFNLQTQSQNRQDSEEVDTTSVDSEQKIQTTEVFTGNSEHRIDIAILNRRDDTKVVKEATINIGASLFSFILPSSPARSPGVRPHHTRICVTSSTP